MAVGQRRRSGRTGAVLAALGVLAFGAAGVGSWLGAGGPAHPAGAAHRRPPVFSVAAWSLVATVDGPVPGYASPTPLASVSSVPPTWAPQFRSMPVVASAPGWDEVRVVARPPEPGTVWIRSGQVELSRTPDHIVVDLGTRRLLLFVRSRLALCPPVALGGAADPTPSGHFFVGLLMETPPSDVGPFAILTSAVASGVTDWEQSGTAMVTIAGSPGVGAPVPGGAATTTGSVGLAPAALARLRPVPLGTPVDVVPALGRRLAPADQRLCRSASGIPPAVHRRAPLG